MFHLRLEYQPLCQPIESVSADASELKKWKRTKKPVLTCYDHAKTHQFMFGLCQAAPDPIQLASAQVRLREVCKNFTDTTDMVSFFGPPIGLCANENIPKNKLKLPAYGQLWKPDPKATHTVGGFSLNPPKFFNNVEKLQEIPHVLVPFWYSSDDGLVNMTLSHQKKEGLEIPFYTNSRGLKAGEFLLCAAPVVAIASNKRRLPDSYRHASLSMAACSFADLGNFCVACKA